MTINSAAAIVAEASGLGVTAGARPLLDVRRRRSRNRQRHLLGQPNGPGPISTRGPNAVALTDKGWQLALRDDQSLALGLNTHAGRLTNEPVGTAVGIDSVDLAAVLA